MRCLKKPRVRVIGYARCEPGTAGRRNTRKERWQKKCKNRGHKTRVGGHRRKVCKRH